MLASNAVAIPVDSALFVLVAFAGVLSMGDVGETFVTNVVVKGVVTLVSIPWIYLVRPGGRPRPGGRRSAAGLGGHPAVEGDLLEGQFREGLLALVGLARGRRW